MAGLYSSIMTVLSLSLLTPYFYFIPKATLASVLVIAVIFMVRILIIFQGKPSFSVAFLIFIYYSHLFFIVCINR